MRYKLKFTDEFQKNLLKLTKSEQKMVAKKLDILIQDPFYPSLRTKKVQGIKNTFEMSVNMDIRIIWKYENNIILLLLTIGHHSILD